MTAFCTCEKGSSSVDDKLAVPSCRICASPGARGKYTCPSNLKVEHLQRPVIFLVCEIVIGEWASVQMGLDVPKRDFGLERGHTGRR